MRHSLLHSQDWKVTLVNCMVEDGSLFAGFAYLDSKLPMQVMVKPSIKSAKQYLIEIPESVRRVPYPSVLSALDDRVQFTILSRS